MTRVVITPVGDLESDVLLRFERELAAAVTAARRHECPLVTVDMRLAGFTGAEFVGVIAAANRQVEGAGGMLTVSGARSVTRRILRLCRLDRVLAVETVAEKDDAYLPVVLPEQVISLDVDHEART